MNFHPELKRHPVDSIALIFGMAGLIAGLVALVHQSGVIDLNLASVIALGVGVVGVGGLSLAALELRRR